MNIKVVVKDPLSIRADAIVNPVGLFIRGDREFNGGLASRIFTAAGSELMDRCRTAIGDESDERRCVISNSYRLRRFKRIVNVLWNYDLALMCAEETRYLPFVFRGALENDCRSAVLPFGWYEGFDFGVTGDSQSGVIATLYKAAQAIPEIKVYVACKDQTSKNRIKGIMEDLRNCETDSFREVNCNFCSESVAVADQYKPIMEETAKDVASLFFQNESDGKHEFVRLLKRRYQWMTDNFLHVINEEDARRYGDEDALGCTISLTTRDTRLLMPATALSGSRPEIRSLLEVPNFGHDLPVWFAPINNATGGKRILIVAQDPLRAKQGSGFLSLSTPFGIHSLGLRAKPGMSRGIVIAVVSRLVSMGWSVWLTDYSKVYAYEDFDGGKNIRKNPVRRSITLNRIFREMVHREVCRFEPNVIMVLGGESANALFNVSGLEVAPLPYDNPCGYEYENELHERRQVPCRIAAHPSWLTSHMGKLAAAGCGDLRVGVKNDVNDFVSYYVDGLDQLLMQQSL